jgi:hypothetical protein
VAHGSLAPKAVLQASSTSNLKSKGELRREYYLPNPYNETYCPPYGYEVDFPIAEIGPCGDGVVTLEGAAALSCLVAGDLKAAVRLRGSADVCTTAHSNVKAGVREHGIAQLSLGAQGNLKTAVRLIGYGRIALVAGGDLKTAVQLTGNGAGALTTV